ncbi:MAG: DUF1549 domain-containing protein, partial [Verrucomicrobiales bacterium]|nr:DUF1549 domain-containing protein [Verrucomicrobiales bacterium]
MSASRPVRLRLGSARHVELRAAWAGTPHLAVLAVILGWTLGSAVPSRADYLRDVKPVLTRHCVPCHGADQLKGGLRLDTAAGARKGGDSGPAVVPGNAAASALIRAIEGTHASVPRMPYKKTPLESSEVEPLRRWIDAGATAPDKEEPGKYVHWAFVAPRRPDVPKTPGTDGDENPIDAFVRERLRRRGLAPAPQADPVTLLRRLHLDLTGLPPTPAEVDAFVADTRPDAYARRVEELLRSPHHGER